MNKLERFLDSLTARQYGEVVFPLFSQKSEMAHFLPSRPALTEPQASVMGTNFTEQYAIAVQV